jgi:ankyrin repeat protein
VSFFKYVNLRGLIKIGYVFSKHDVNIKDLEGNTPLYYSSMRASVQLVYFLLSRGADATTACSNNDTPLHMAFVSKENPSKNDLYDQALIISTLISAGADLNALNRKK